MGQKFTISVIGAHSADEKLKKLAMEVGKIVAKSGAVLVCGGLDGAMKAAAKGAKAAGGLTIGLLPGKDKRDANPYIDIALPTSIGYARNVMVACSADLIIALPGSNGTRCEISYGLVYGRPTFDLGDWNIEGMVKVKDLEDLGKMIKEHMKKAA